MRHFLTFSKLIPAVFLWWGCTERIQHAALSDAGNGDGTTLTDLGVNCEITPSTIVIEVGETCRPVGAPTLTAPLVVEGTLAMLPGDSLTAPSITVASSGRLDIRGDSVRGWSENGWDPDWANSDTVVTVPFDANTCDEFPTFSEGDEPVTNALGTAELINLTRSITINASLAIDSRQSQHVVGTTIGGAVVISNCEDDCGDSTFQSLLIQEPGSVGLTLNGTAGLSFLDTVIYRSEGIALQTDSDQEGDENNDLIFERLLVADIADTGNGTSAVSLGRGSLNAIRDSRFVSLCFGRVFRVADRARPLSWTFEDIVAHNIRGELLSEDMRDTQGPGLTIDGFRAFYARSGFEFAGMTLDAFDGKNLDLRFIDNVAIAFRTVAGSGPTYGVIFDGVRIENTPTAVLIESSSDADSPPLFRQFSWTDVDVPFSISSSGRTSIDIVESDAADSDISFDQMVDGSVVRVQNTDASFQLRVMNGMVVREDIAPFYP